MWGLYAHKDKTDTMQQCGVVYKVQCGECKDTYIGETARLLKTRLGEHQKLPSSTLHEHVSKTRHEIDWDGFKVIDRESIDIPRK